MNVPGSLPLHVAPVNYLTPTEAYNPPPGVLYIPNKEREPPPERPSDLLGLIPAHKGKGVPPEYPNVLAPPAGRAGVKDRPCHYRNR